VLALTNSAYLAAVYLAWEATDSDIREDFRRRALATWWIGGIVSLAMLAVAFTGAPRLWSGLTSWPGVALIAVGALLAPLSFDALRRRRLTEARRFGAAQVVALLLGWAVKSRPGV
jgi:cytochrome d ubiquinol oxidase subunit II